MRRRLRAAAGVAAALVVSSAAIGARAATPSAAQIVARNVAARGGLAAWRRIRTMTWVGHVESARAPMPSMPFTLDEARPNRTRFEIDAVGERTVRVFDGAQGWKLRPAANGMPVVTPYGAAELQFAASAPGLDGPLIDYRAKHSSVSFEGIDRVYGRKAYRIGVVLASGERDRVWIDARDFLELRYDRSLLSARGKALTVSMYYHDYKSYGGLEIPTLIETGVGSAAQPDRLVIERILLNPTLDAETFAMPEAAPADLRAENR